jgi:hypothetical protein
LIHAILNGTSLVALYIGLIIIEYNKGWDPSHHWKSVHAYMGVVTYILLLIQSIVGFTQYYTPSLYGGVNKAKAVWKYHRMSGYIVLALGLATMCAATQTTYVETVLNIPLWSVLTASILVLLGTLPRIKFQKFGFKN